MTSDAAATSTRARRARVIGRIGRLALGMFLIWQVVPVFGRTEWAFHRRVLVIVLGLVAFYVAVHWVVATFRPNLNPWLGAVLAVTPVVLAFVLGDAAWQTAVFSFIGGSLVLDAVLGNAGCEVMSLPGIVLRKRTHLVCIAFSPIDWAEERLAERRAARS